MDPVEVELSFKLAYLALEVKRAIDDLERHQQELKMVRAGNRRIASETYLWELIRSDCWYIDQLRERYNLLKSHKTLGTVVHTTHTKVDGCGIRQGI